MNTIKSSQDKTVPARTAIEEMKRDIERLFSIGSSDRAISKAIRYTDICIDAAMYSRDIKGATSGVISFTDNKSGKTYGISCTKEDPIMLLDGAAELISKVQAYKTKMLRS